jgi:hypothetical protein
VRVSFKKLYYIKICKFMTNLWLLFSTIGCLIEANLQIRSVCLFADFNLVNKLNFKFKNTVNFDYYFVYTGWSFYLN